MCVCWGGRRKHVYVYAYVYVHVNVNVYAYVCVCMNAMCCAVCVRPALIPLHSPLEAVWNCIYFFSLHEIRQALPANPAGVSNLLQTLGGGFCAGEAGDG